MTPALNTDQLPPAPLAGLAPHLGESQRTLWVLGGNDLEMKAIKALLSLYGQPIRDFHTGWGEHKYGPADLGLASSTGDDPDSEKLSAFRTVCFIECGPKNPGEDCWENTTTDVIDHHGSRSSEPASIMQVLTKLGGMGLEISDSTRRFVELVALNDTGHIDAMRWLGASADEMTLIRALDRRAQGVTAEQEEQAEIAIREKKVEGRLTIIELPHSKCAPVTDQLHENYDQLLILSANGEMNFYGDGKLCRDLAKTFPGGWSGSRVGHRGDSGYWGSKDASREDVLLIIRQQLGVVA